MVCYYHADRPATGICKHCGRALCSECAVPVDDVLACRGRHEQQVQAANAAEARLIRQAGRIGAGYLRNAVFYGLVGILFTGFGLMQYRFLGLQAVFFMLIGIFLLYAAIANLLEGRKYR